MFSVVNFLLDEQSLDLSLASNQKSNIGQLLNLIANDIQTLQDTAIYIIMVLSSPLQVTMFYVDGHFIITF